ncbi:hypothetical protein, partial [Hydrogenibacillus schlegelii]|uniref:hypothetical protein n=1 Tax=Hydrogenibacillus schlegelii TaxID=1484 RepID=UPI0034A031C9
ERPLARRLADHAGRARHRGEWTLTPVLDPGERSEAELVARSLGAGVRFYGGQQAAERARGPRRSAGPARAPGAGGAGGGGAKAAGLEGGACAPRFAFRLRPGVSDRAEGSAHSRVAPAFGADGAPVPMRRRLSSVSKTFRRRGRDRRSREGTSGAAFVLDDGMAGSAG